MSLFSTRAEQLAAHLRSKISKNELQEPLPSQRKWARQLAVGPKSLSAALDILKKQGLLDIDMQNSVHLSRRVKRSVTPPQGRVVRILYDGSDYSADSTFINWAGPLLAILQKKGGQLIFETPSDARWRDLCDASVDRSSDPGDLLMPLSVSAKYQQMLTASGRPCVYIGTPAEGGTLPYLLCDLTGAIRHATHTLIRRGFRNLSFLLTKADCPGHLAMEETFMRACREWKGQSIQAQMLSLKMNDEEERSAIDRFVSRMAKPQGILLMPPIPTDLVATTLLAKRVRMPAEADIIVVTSAPGAVRIHPPISHYPFPLEIFVKTLANAIFNFWETGEYPSLRKVLPMKMVSPSGNSTIRSGTINPQVETSSEFD